MPEHFFQDFAYAFLSILLEGAPFILLGTLVSGFIDVYMPAGAIDRLLPKGRGKAIMVAGLLGAILPVCECAVVPVIRRLLKKGLPFSCALTYMLAAPIVNPITALSTMKAFGGSSGSGILMTSSRLLLGYLVAVTVGLIILKMPRGWFLRGRVMQGLAGKKKEECQHDHEHGESCGHDHHHGDHHHHEEKKVDRLVLAMRSTLKDFVEVAVYFVIGVAITALFNVGVTPGENWLDQMAETEWGGPAVLMVMAFILSLCSTSDAFIAATLHRFTDGARLAFLVFGPMMDVKLIFLYRTILKKRAILGLALGLFMLIAVLSVLWQRIVIAL